jgi:peptidoglycan/xylan/chitin deacetylase (PgdA/CDA1 family)
MTKLIRITTPHQLKRTLLHRFLLIIPIVFFLSGVSAQQTDTTFKWPEGKRAAISLTFDDARLSQVDTGISLLNQYGVKATFFLVPSGVEQRIDGWKKAVASGQEIGNHTMTHPCTGNFSWSRKNALENYNLDDIRNELTECNTRIKDLLVVTPEVFAYPCGQKFIGRDSNTKSYVPLISKMFILGRGWRDEAMNDPAFCDMSQISGIEMDGKNFDEILPLIEEAKKTGQWLVLAGHEMGGDDVQTTRLTMLKQLMEYAQDPFNGIWLAPAGTVAKYIDKYRQH